MSLRDGKCCYATRSVRCVGSVATRREGLLRNDKCDFVTISVVTSLDHSVGFADTSRRFHCHFSARSLPLLAASFRRTSQMLCALPSASPTLLAGFACTSRGFSNRTSRRFHRHFSNVYSLIGGSVATFSPLPPSWNIAAFNSASDKVPPAESAKSFSTLGRSDSFSAENLPR